jgi:hypothetical protein
MHYITLYDATIIGSKFLYTGFVIMLMIISLAWSAKKNTGKHRKGILLSLLMVVLFLGLLTLLYTSRVFSSKSYIENKDYRVIEGIITEIKPKIGRGSGSFTINQVQFVYASTEIDNALKQPYLLEKYPKSGDIVRVSYRDTTSTYQDILKIELAAPNSVLATPTNP